jgi:ABC-type ATPase involved in cell division
MENKGNRYFADFSHLTAERVLGFMERVVARPAIEVFYGIKTKTLNWPVCLGLGLACNVLILTHGDQFLLKHIFSGWFHQPRSPIGYGIYCFFFAFSGFIGWGLWQTVLYNRVSKRLTEVFQTSGLKNSIGKLPSFIFDKPIDDVTRQLRVTKASFPVSQFKSAKENLESALQIYIDDIKENREYGTVDITYSSLAMPEEVKLEHIGGTGPDKFVIGKTRAQQVIADLNQIPHFLVGGQSGGGKSTFLRQMFATLYLNNPNYRFVMVDLKEGLEFQLFKNLERVAIVSDATGAVSELIRIEAELKERMDIFKKAEVKDIVAYLQKSVQERKKLESKSDEKLLLSRLIVVVDEAAELFMAGDKSKGGGAQQAKSHAIKIAAQGRAVGIHLVIATQRPDVRAVDGQIKANLSGMLAFQMPNFASSMTILDSGRASHLPKVPGRAIWKTGLETVELQTPYMTVEEVTKLLKLDEKSAEDTDEHS